MGMYDEELASIKPTGGAYDDLLAQLPSNQKSIVDRNIDTLKNIPSSAINVGKGIISAVAHPIDTVGGMLDVGAGALHNILPESITQPIDKAFPSPATNRAVNAADAVGQFYKNRYGGLENLKNTLNTDPIGSLMDLSTVTGVGAMATPGKLGEALNTTSRVTNPINAVTPIVKPIANGIGNLVATGIGELGTHTGAESIKNAYQAGVENNKSFTDNLLGKVPLTDVLESAKSGLQNMRTNSSKEYRENKANWASNQTPLDFTPIDKAFNNTVDSLKNGDHWKIGSAEQAKIQEIGDILSEWRKDPQAHTAEGLDALKQRIDAVYPDNPAQSQVQRVISSTRNAVKQAIVDQAPDYAASMTSYEDAMNMQNEIKRALSLGDRASADTALRKLQSLTRNNVSTNYGNRLELAKALEEGGGKDILPALSGQALSAWTPRGLGKLSASATAGASLTHPGLLALLPLQSPKIMGATAYGAGRVSNAVGGITPEALKYLYQLSNLTNQPTQQQ